MAAGLLKAKNKNTVAFVNQKGGVGKTTLAAMTASGLARAGQRVLMVDGDPQGNLSLFYRKEEKSDLLRLFQDALKDQLQPSPDYIIKAVRPGLDILPMLSRNFRYALTEVELYQASSRIVTFFDQLKSGYDWIIIDSSPSNGELERILLSLTEAVIVPLEFQLFSISGLSALLEEIRRAAQEYRTGLTVEALVFNKAENRLNRVQEYRKLFTNYQIPIFEICKSEYMMRAVESGKTVWETAPSSYLAADLQKMIDGLFTGSRG